MKTVYCSKKEHQDNPLNLVCLEKNCEQNGLLCSFCLISQHKSHVKQCVPLQDLFLNLNKANNPKIREQLELVGGDILKQQRSLLTSFKSFIKQIESEIKAIQKSIETEMEKLLSDAQLFVGNALQKVLDQLNSDQVTPETINQEIKKMLTLINVSEQGQISVLGETEKERQAKRIMKMVEVLGREARYYLEKSILDLGKVEKAITQAKGIKPILKQSDARLTISREGWNMGKVEAITIEHKKKKEIWMSGLFVYQPITWPDEKEKVEFQLEIREGAQYGQDIQPIFQQLIQIEQKNVKFEKFMTPIQLSQAIKFQPSYKYTISLKPTQPYLSYYGINGRKDTKEFIYEDTVFQIKDESNSTSINFGMFPMIYYEE